MYIEASPSAQLSALAGGWDLDDGHSSYLGSRRGGSARGRRRREGGDEWTVRGLDFSPPLPPPPEPVGIRVRMGADPAKVTSDEAVFAQDLVATCAWCTSVSTERCPQTWLLPLASSVSHSLSPSLSIYLSLTPPPPRVPPPRPLSLLPLLLLPSYTTPARPHPPPLLLFSWTRSYPVSRPHSLSGPHLPGPLTVLISRLSAHVVTDLSTAASTPHLRATGAWLRAST